MILNPGEKAILAAAAIGIIATVVVHAAEVRHIAKPAACPQTEASMPVPAWLEEMPTSAEPGI